MLMQLRKLLSKSSLGQVTHPSLLSRQQSSILPDLSPFRTEVLSRTQCWSPASAALVSTKTQSRPRTRSPKINLKKVSSKKLDEAIHGESSSKAANEHKTQPASNRRVELILGVFELPDEAKADDMLNKYPKLKYHDEESILDMRDFLRQKGVSVSRFLTMPWIFTLPKNLVKEKVGKVMYILGIDNFLTAIPFLELSIQRLFELGNRWNSELKHMNSKTSERVFKNRLEYMAFQLQCEQFEVADMMLKFPMLMSISFPTIKKKLQLLLDNEIRPEDIVRDPYIFSHTAAKIEARLVLTKQHGLGIVKPWLLRCIQSTYDSYVDRLNQEQALLSGHKDIKSFLSQRLGCNSALVADILFRVPSVKTASASKLNEMIVFLYAQGFSTDHILETPRILGHSVETVNQRITQLASYGFKINSLSLLCQTTKNYNSFLRKLRVEVGVPDE